MDAGDHRALNEKPADVHQAEIFSTKRMKVIDRLGITASALCTVHCMVTPFILTALPVVAAKLLRNDTTHHGLVGFVTVFGLSGCIFGYQRHKSLRVLLILLIGLAIILFGTFFVGDFWGEVFEAPVMVLGSSLMISGHLINLRLKSIRTKVMECCSEDRLQDVHNQQDH